MKSNFNEGYYIKKINLLKEMIVMLESQLNYNTGMKEFPLDLTFKVGKKTKKEDSASVVEIKKEICGCPNGADVRPVGYVFSEEELLEIKESLSRHYKEFSSSKLEGEYSKSKSDTPSAIFLKLDKDK